MKKILIVLSALALSSCEIKHEPIVSRNTEVLDKVYHFEYMSHDYIMFRHGFGYSSIAGVVHDPDCKCNNSKKYDDAFFHW